MRLNVYCCSVSACGNITNLDQRLITCNFRLRGILWHGTGCLLTTLPVVTDGALMHNQFSYKERLLEAARVRLLEAADAAEKKAARATEPSVRETMLALMALYRDMAKQLEELESLRSSLHQHQ